MRPPPREKIVKRRRRGIEEVSEKTSQGFPVLLWRCRTRKLMNL
jgi:hypothetical protein